MRKHHHYCQEGVTAYPQQPERCPGWQHSQVGSVTHREAGAALALALMRCVGAEGASKMVEFSLPPPSGCCDCCCVFRAILETTCRIIALAGLCAQGAHSAQMSHLTGGVWCAELHFTHKAAVYVLGT